MDEDPCSGVREPDSTPAEAGDTLDTSRNGVNANSDRNRHLESIAECFGIAYELLPPEAQQTYENFLMRKDYDAFYKELEQSIQSQVLSGDFLSGEPEFRLAINKLFRDKYSSIESFCRAQGNLKHTQPTGETHAKQRRQPDSYNSKHLPTTLTLTGSEGDLLDQASSPLEKKNRPTLNREDTPGHNFRDTSTTISSLLEGTPDRGSPDFVILGDLPQGKQMSRRNPHDHAAVAGSSSVPHREPVNLAICSGKNVSPLGIELNRAKIFLRDNDIDKTADWGPKFQEIAKYCLQLIPQAKGVARGAPWISDLEEVMEMLNAHEQFEQYHYGPRPLVLDFPNPFPAVSKRLPPISGFTIDSETDPKDWVLDNRELIRKGDKSIHDVQYSLKGLLPSYLKAYEFDVREMWDHASNHPHRRRGAEYLDLADQLFNMARAENETFDYCIYRGMRMSSYMMKSERRFQKSDEVLAPHERDEPHVTDLKSWSKFRGARRAALQQCLNMFDNMENRVMCSPWRAMVIQQPEKTSLFVLWDTPVLKDPPKQETHDPFGYTIAHKWYMEEERIWANWARPHGIKEAYGHKLWIHREEPVMDLPYNFMGPYVHHDMDKDMKKVHDALLRYRGLSQRLARANLKSPRQALDDTINYISKGLQGVGPEHLNLVFREDEFQAAGELMPIRLMEEDWLNYLGSASVNERTIRSLQNQLRLEGLARVFEVRVVTMLNDISPKALFRDTKTITLDEFMEELNRCAEGPVRRHVFTREETIKYGQILAERGELNMGIDTSCEATISRPTMTIHPEDRIRWILPARPAWVRPEKEPIPPEKAGGSLSQRYDDDAMSTSTISTKVSVLESEAHEHPAGMPHLQHLSDWNVALDLRDPPKMHNFICCLGYRFGKTMYDLKQKYKKNQEALTQVQRESNRDFLATIVRYWEDDAARRPNNPKKNPTAAKDRVTPAYRDIVRMAEPEKFKKEWEEPVHNISAAEAESWHLTRTGIIREAYENKSLLLPTRAIKTEGPGGLMWDIKMREPIWSFAHPNRRGTAPRFWNMNRWPVHLQLEETQAEIKASGPKQGESIVLASPRAQRFPPPPTPQVVRTATVPHFAPQVGQFAPAESSQQHLVEAPQDIEVPYFNPDVGRRQFKPGVTQYWAGDTPHQKKVIENRIRGMLETKPTKRSWWETLVSKRRKLSDPFALPEIDPRDIPKSKPREPTPESLDEDERVGTSEGEDAPEGEARVKGKVALRGENVSQGGNSPQTKATSMGKDSSEKEDAPQKEDSSEGGSSEEGLLVADNEKVEHEYTGKIATLAGATFGREDEDESRSDNEVENEADSLVRLPRASHSPRTPRVRVQHTRVQHGQNVAEPLNLRIPSSSGKKRRRE